MHRRCTPRGLSLVRAPGWYCVVRSFSMLFCVLPTGAGPACAQVNNKKAGAHTFFLGPEPAPLALPGWLVYHVLHTDQCQDDRGALTVQSDACSLPAALTAYAAVWI